jgi:tetratricopeptide (TPR) repeat protein
MMAWYLEKYEEAFTYYQHAKKSAHNNGGLQAESKLLADLGYRLRRLCRFDEAIKYGNECLEICKKLGLGEENFRKPGCIRKSYRNQGFHSKAENIFQQAITLAKQSGKKELLLGI